MKYGKKVMENFMNPKNMGEIKNYDGIGKIGNPTCGDIIWVYIKVKNNKLEDVKFKTFGCAAAIASSSMITQIAKGKTLMAAKKITRGKVAEKLKGLPESKLHCSTMAIEGLKLAIWDWEKKGK